MLKKIVVVAIAIGMIFPVRLKVSASETSDLTIGTVVTSSIEVSNEVDEYRITLNEATTLSIEYTSQLSFDSTIQLYNSDKTTKLKELTAILSANGKQTLSIDVEAGVYFLDIVGGTDSIGTYTLLATKTTGLTDQEPNNTLNEAQNIVLNNTVNGFLSQLNTVDIYKFIIDKPTIVNINSKGPLSNGIDLLILNSTGKVIDNFQNLFLNSTILKNSLYLKPGTYYLQFQTTTSSSVKATGYYSFNLTTTAFDVNEKESNNSTTSANLLILNGSETKATITPTDNLDYYKFILTEPGRVKLNAKSMLSGSLYINIFDSNDNIIFYESLVFTGATITVPIRRSGYAYLQPGTYYVQVNGEDTLKDEIYTLDIDFTKTGSTEIELNDDYVTAKPLMINSDPLVGIIDSVELIDVFKIIVPANGYYKINTSSEVDDVLYMFVDTLSYTELLSKEYTASSYGNPVKHAESIYLTKGTYYVSAASFGSGRYSIQVTSTSAPQLITAKDSSNVNVSNNGIINKDVTVSTTSITGVKKSVTKDGKSYTWPTGNKFTSTGKYVVTVKDLAGSSKTFTFTIDKNAPTIKGTEVNSKQVISTNGYANESILLSISDLSSYSKSVTKDGKAYTWPTNSTFTSNGKYVVTAKDKYGKISTYTFIIDKTKPTLSIKTTGGTVLATNSYTKSSVIVSYKDTYYASKTVTKNGKSYTWPSTNTFTSDGKYIVTIKDKAGNISTMTFIIDKTAPKITAKNTSGTIISNGGSSKSTVTVAITESNIKSKVVTLNGKSYTWPTNSQFTVKGTYVVTVIDQVGYKTTYTFKII